MPHQDLWSQHDPIRKAWFFKQTMSLLVRRILSKERIRKVNLFSQTLKLIIDQPYSQQSKRVITWSNFIYHCLDTYLNLNQSIQVATKCSPPF